MTIAKKKKKKTYKCIVQLKKTPVNGNAVYIDLD